MRLLSQEAENLGGYGSSLRPRFVIFSHPGLLGRAYVMPDFSIRVFSLFLLGERSLLQIIDIAEDSSDVDGCCSASVLNASFRLPEVRVFLKPESRSEDGSCPFFSKQFAFPFACSMPKKERLVDIVML